MKIQSTHSNISDDVELIQQKSRNSLRVLQHISPGWDHDLHVHSNWSQDNLHGPSFSDYLQISERSKIHLGFSDHFELLFYETQDKRWGTWKLTPESIENYLEELDSVKSQYSHVSSGLEIDYYSNESSKMKLHEFVDDYRKQFDLLIGSVHELDEFHPITIKEGLIWILKKYGSMENVIQKYFELESEMIQTQMFDVIAHPDVVYRFSTPEDRKENPLITSDKRLLDIGYLCKQTNTLMEVNLSGFRYPWNQSFPSLEIINHLLVHDVKFIVGSDSHSLQNFKDSILNIRKFNNLFRNHFFEEKL